MAIYNMNDFDELFTKINEEVIYALSERTLTLLEKHIMNDMYGALPNKQYEDGTGMPTFQFKRAFAFGKLVKAFNSVSRGLIYDWASMDSPSPNHPTRHGNYKNGTITDRRQELADILNRKGLVGGKMRNLYWDNFINELNQNIGKWIYTEYNNRGVKLNKNKLSSDWDLDL